MSAVPLRDQQDPMRSQLGRREGNLRNAGSVSSLSQAAVEERPHGSQEGSVSGEVRDSCFAINKYLPEFKVSIICF